MLGMQENLPLANISMNKPPYAKGQPLAIHLEALLSKLKPHTEQLYVLSRDYQTSFGLGSTAKFPTSNEIKLSREIIIKIAELNLSFDFDLYFHYDDE